MNSNQESAASHHGVEWEEVLNIFGYDEPRKAQAEGMEMALETVGNNGYVVLEGACGTGKTMLALSPLISLVRSESTKFERIVVVTSVKQQQRAFESDLQKINSELPSGTHPVSGVTLVGKADVCPFTLDGTIGEGDIYSECERLRENTRSIAEAGDNPKSEAESLAGSASTMILDNDNAPEWDAGSPNYPYPPTLPVSDGGSEYCPFYAQHISNSIEDADKDGAANREVIPFDLQSQGLVTTEDLVQMAGEAGTCPHSVMGEVMRQAEVVIANYYHIFEPTTVAQFTDELIDEETLLVCDEAHNLVPRVRDLLSDSISAASITRTITELETVQNLLTVDLEHLDEVQGKDIDLDWQRKRISDEALETAEEVRDLVHSDETLANDIDEFVEFATAAQDLLGDTEYDDEALESYSEFLEGLLEILDDKVRDRLTEEYGDYWQDADHEDLEVPLRDPEEPRQDDFSQWASLRNEFSHLVNAESVGDAVAGLFEYLYTEVRDLEDTPTVYSQSVGRLLTEWGKNDHTTYFREITVSPRWGDGKENLETGYNWERHFDVEMCLKNCIPSEKLAARFDEFGGGIMMSATLEPLDVFKEVAGVEDLESEDRPIVEKRFGLSFPEPNRESFAVDLPAFKYSAKGSPKNGSRPNLRNDVRKSYRDSIVDVVTTTPGNVLISMPSYAEGVWAAEVLRRESEVDKEVLADESSADHITEQLKQEFFGGGDKVLVTGAHGTLVEGVDYKGEKLNAVIVCGVPLENSRSPYSRAIKTAFEEDNRFDGDGFEKAFATPAVRKSRQSVGRVIRSENDIGVRVLLDERYTDKDRWDSVRHLFPSDEREEFTSIEPDTLRNRLEAFWKYQEQRGEDA